MRTVNGVYLTDEQMLEHYIGLVKRYGRLTAKYRNAICYVQDEEHVYEAMEPDMESEKFWLTDVPIAASAERGFRWTAFPWIPEPENISMICLRQRLTGWR